MRERTTITQAGRRHCTPYNVSCCTCAHRPIIVTKPTYDQNASLRLRQCYNHCCTPQASCRTKMFSPHRHHRPALPRSHSGPTPPRRHCCRQRIRHLRPVTAVTAATKHGRNAQAGESKRCCHERWRWQKGATASGARERDTDGDKIDNTRAVKETKKKSFSFTKPRETRKPRCFRAYRKKASRGVPGARGTPRYHPRAGPFITPASAFPRDQHQSDPFCFSLTSGIARSTNHTRDVVIHPRHKRPTHHIVSCHIISYHVISSHIMSYHKYIQQHVYYHTP